MIDQEDARRPEPLGKGNKAHAGNAGTPPS
jgi:hypothetical protein